YNRVFDRWWRQRRRYDAPFQPPTMPSPEEAEPADAEEGAAEPTIGDERQERSADERGIPMPSASDEDVDDEAPIDEFIVAPDAYSQQEVLRHREFDRMTPA